MFHSKFVFCYLQFPRRKETFVENRFLLPKCIWRPGEGESVGNSSMSLMIENRRTLGMPVFYLQRLLFDYLFRTDRKTMCHSTAV